MKEPRALAPELLPTYPATCPACNPPGPWSTAMFDDHTKSTAGRVLSSCLTAALVALMGYTMFRLGQITEIRREIRNYHSVSSESLSRGWTSQGPWRRT